MEGKDDRRMQRMWEGIKKAWYKFSRNPLSVVGAISVLLVFFLLTFAPHVAPYPKHAGNFVNFS